jgi:hypothetical protein
MKEFQYKDGKAELRIALPRSKYSTSFKIDTGASLTALPVGEFKNFFSSDKDIMSGKYIALSSASGGRMEGYTHKTLVKVIGYDEEIILDICFYNGLRALLGMDMIQKYFRICFEESQK